MGKIFVRHHLGMGDHIAHNGLIRKVSEDYPNHNIYISSKEHNYENVKFMFRDNLKVNVLQMNDHETNVHLESVKYDKIIDCSFSRGGSWLAYVNYGDDIFYKIGNYDPKIRKTHFFIQRDYDREIKLYEQIINDLGTEDYLFLHEKPNENILIDRKKINSNLPFFLAKKEYKFFDLLTTIEKAKEVHIISSSFLSYFMIQKLNDKTFAHMYADRNELSDFVKNNQIEIIL
jgi:hypothetical protein